MESIYNTYILLLLLLLMIPDKFLLKQKTLTTHFLRSFYGNLSILRKKKTEAIYF